MPGRTRVSEWWGPERRKQVDNDDFDREFAKTARTTRGVFIFACIVITVVVAFAIWAGYTVVMHFFG
jgi:hypothetical protein